MLTMGPWNPVTKEGAPRAPPKKRKRGKTPERKRGETRSEEGQEKKKKSTTLEEPKGGPQKQATEKPVGIPRSPAHRGRQAQGQN